MDSLYPKIVALLRENANSGIFPAHISTHPLSPDTKLSELGIDSLGMMALLAALMELTDRYFPDDAFSAENTLAEVATIAADWEA